MAPQLFISGVTSYFIQNISNSWNLILGSIIRCIKKEKAYFPLTYLRLNSFKTNGFLECGGSRGTDIFSGGLRGQNNFITVLRHYLIFFTFIFSPVYSGVFRRTCGIWCIIALAIMECVLCVFLCFLEFSKVVSLGYKYVHSQKLT